MKKLLCILVLGIGIFWLSNLSYAADYKCPASNPIDCGNGWCCPSGYSCGSGGMCHPPKPTCPSSTPIDCGNGLCCQAGHNCCSGGGCCPASSPIGCPSMRKCYTNQQEAERDGCRNWEVCGVPR